MSLTSLSLFNETTDSENETDTNASISVSSISSCDQGYDNDKDAIINAQKKEIDNLKAKLYSMARLLADKTGHDTLKIEDVLEENENLKVMIKSKDLTLAYWSELNLTVNSFTSKKNRQKQIQKERKFDRRTLRDVMQVHIFPFMKFCDMKLMHSLNEGSIALSIMKVLNIEEANWAPWWARNQEMAEGLLVEHRTKSSQNMKVSFNKGMKTFIHIFLSMRKSFSHIFAQKFSFFITKKRIRKQMIGILLQHLLPSWNTRYNLWMTS